MLNMDIDATGIHFVAGWEAFIPYVYDDKRRLIRVGGKLVPPEYTGTEEVIGTLTCGFGHTDDAAHPLKMKDLIGKRLTLEQGYDILHADLSECVQFVNKSVKVPVSQGQFNALTSITFNFGTSNLKKSQLLAKLNRGDYDGARAAFDLYIRSKGEVMPGLQNRRDAEQRLWDGMDKSNVPCPDPKEQYVETPRGIDRTTPAKSMAASKIGNTQIAVTALTVAGGVANAVAQSDTPVPVKTVTQVVNHAGEIISSTSQLINNLPEPGLIQKLAHTMFDPYVFGGVVLVIAGLCAWAWYERHKHNQEGTF